MATILLCFCMQFLGITASKSVRGGSTWNLNRTSLWDQSSFNTLFLKMYVGMTF